jgi:hypothetical protein
MSAWRDPKRNLSGSHHVALVARSEASVFFNDGSGGASHAIPPRALVYRLLATG